jgi:hypothetical protein
MSKEEPSAIDEKKAEDEGTTTEKADWGGFFKNFSNGLISGILIGVVCVGSIGLFLAKAANANVFPTEINMQPYTNVKRDLTEEIIFMNPVKILSCYGLGFWDEPEKYWIQEANFFNEKADINFMDKFFNMWLCSLQKKTDSFFWVFETDVLKSMMCMSFFIISSVFFYMNYLPEWLTMLVFSLSFAIILMGIYVSNFIYGIYTHIVKLIDLISVLLKPNNEDPFLSDYPGIIMYSILYFWAAFFSVLISPALITIYTLFKALSVNYIVRKKDNKSDEPAQKMNLISFIKNVFYYKKTFIIILAMLKLLSSTSSYLGSSYMPGAIIAILILIFGLNILIPDDADDTLFSVLNTNFPPLDKQVPKEGINVEICNPDINKLVANADNKPSIISIVTKQPSNVLEVASPGNKMIGGGKRTPVVTKSKQKLYNLKLV